MPDVVAEANLESEVRCLRFWVRTLWLAGAGAGAPPQPSDIAPAHLVNAYCVESHSLLSVAFSRKRQFSVQAGLGIEEGEGMAPSTPKTEAV